MNGWVIAGTALAVTAAALWLALWRWRRVMPLHQPRPGDVDSAYRDARAIQSRKEPDAIWRDFLADEKRRGQ